MNTSDARPPGDDKRSGLIRRFFRAPRYSAFLVVVALASGIVVGAPALDYTDRYFSSDAFCATGCHVMEATVAKELHESSHWTRSSGVRATCGDCHVSEGLFPAMVDHAIGIKELYAFAVGGIRTPEQFEELRAESANRVRLGMVANGSQNCLKCHTPEAIKPERRRGQKQHAEAQKNSTSCIACHYNLVHKEFEPSDAFLKATGEL